MDSKKKYDKNKHWKKKYQSKSSVAAAQKLFHLKNEELIDQFRAETINKLKLKQPLPQDGWFPEVESSSSDFENFESLSGTQEFVSKPNSDSDYVDIKSSTNQFDWEPHGFEHNSNFTICDKDEQLSKKSKKSVGNNHLSLPPIKNTGKKSTGKSSPFGINNEEDELIFLLSLKEGTHSGPVNVKTNNKNERGSATFNYCCMRKELIKSNDLEEWLDSVLDD